LLDGDNQELMDMVLGNMQLRDLLNILILFSGARELREAELMDLENLLVIKYYIKQK